MLVYIFVIFLWPSNHGCWDRTYVFHFVGSSFRKRVFGVAVWWRSKEMVALTSSLPEPLVLPKAWLGRAGAIPRSEVSRRRRAGSRDREKPNGCLEKELPLKGC